MPSERIQRRIDALLDEADMAVTAGAWSSVAEKARAVLAIEDGNEDALAFMAMAEANISSAGSFAATDAPVSASAHRCAAV